MKQIVTFYSPQVIHISHTLIQDILLSPQLLNLQLKESNILKTLAILHLSLGERGLLNFDLLIEQGQLVITTDKLGTKDVSFTYDLEFKNQEV